VASKTATFSKGDWIVHTYYGVGQIKGIETKQIDDSKTKYFKVDTKNSIYFVPVNNIDVERVRPVASQYMIRKVKKILKDKPEELPLDHNIRKRHISNLLTDCSLVTAAKLIRDLTNRKSISRLNDHEEKTLENLIDQLVLEWSIVIKSDIEKASQQFEEALSESPRIG
jgi:RNA polymerase-interacting CarD/CdnL/TRCF family regulator